jgi:hypothetical protein
LARPLHLSRIAGFLYYELAIRGKMRAGVRAEGDLPDAIPALHRSRARRPCQRRPDGGRQRERGLDQRTHKLRVTQRETMTAQKIFPFFMLLFLLFALTAASHATLIVEEPVAGEFVVIDTDTNLMWLKDANTAGSMTWDAAMAWADGLDYAGLDDWRLPSALNSDGSGPCSGVNCTDSEMGYLYSISLGNPVGGPLTNTGPFGSTLQPDFYWSGTEYAPDPFDAWGFHFDAGEQHTFGKDSGDQGPPRYAWAVRVIPEPTTGLLVGLGLVGLAAQRRRR